LKIWKITISTKSIWSPNLFWKNKIRFFFSKFRWWLSQRTNINLRIKINLWINWQSS
jgi:hypothetical protein